jgi:hypothetical protein
MRIFPRRKRVFGGWLAGEPASHDLHPRYKRTMSTIPCDFCPHPVDRGQMEEIEISHYVPDSSGDDLAYARTYFFGHPDCVRKFYRGLVEHKLDLFKHMPSSAPVSPEEQK